MLKKLYLKLIDRLATRLIAKYSFIPVDFQIGDNYLSRWFVIKNTKELNEKKHKPLRPETIQSQLCNVYLHRVTQSDDDRALHDHPWWNISIILRGAYKEVLVDREVIRRAGAIVIRRASTAHRLVVHDGPVWSLFITFPQVREWGFRCPKGFVHWKEFTGYDVGEPGKVGKGCD